MHKTGHSKLVHWDNRERWDREGGGKVVQDGRHMYTHGWFMLMYSKNHYKIVKQLASNAINKLEKKKKRIETIPKYI